MTDRSMPGGVGESDTPATPNGGGAGVDGEASVGTAPGWDVMIVEVIVALLAVSVTMAVDAAVAGGAVGLPKELSLVGAKVGNTMGVEVGGRFMVAVGVSASAAVQISENGTIGGGDASITEPRPHTHPSTIPS
jgi:hypothetical protein